MPSVRAPVAKLAPGRRTLDRDASKYLCKVLRLEAGDRFVAFDAAARTEGDAVIEEASPIGATVTIERVYPARVVSSAPLALVYGLAKGEKVDAVVRDATELGATLVAIARTARAIGKADKSDRWRRIAEQAARQCGRGDPPEIAAVLDWAEALDAAAAHATARFCLWEEATEPLGPRLAAAVIAGDGIAIAVGPEGGLTAEEAKQAEERGFSPASLGPIILRTETVPAAVLGAVMVMRSGASGD